MKNTVFVSMPFGDKPDSPDNEWTKLYEYGLKPLEKDIPGLPEGVVHTPVTLWRADRELESLTLKTNVMRGIAQSHFVLGVLTTSVARGTHGLRLTNPNVLWELGYAEAIGKPIVVLADSDDLRRLPVLAGLPNVCVYDHNIVQAAKAKNAPEALLHISRGLVQHIAKASEEAARGAKGLVMRHAHFYPSRDIIDLPEMIAGAEKQVDILTTNLEYFRSRRFPSNPHPFEQALANGATVRIVTMDPESVIAEYRARQLNRGQDVPGYRRELRTGIIRFFGQFGDTPDFHLHTYNDLPLQITTRVDHRIITSVVTIGERARKRIQIQFHLNDEGVTESFISHFQSMFDNSTDVSGLKWVVRPGLEDSRSAKDTTSRGTKGKRPAPKKRANKRMQRTTDTKRKASARKVPKRARRR
jgi:hypothetical protein